MAWSIFLIGMVAVSIVATAVRAIAREDLEARTVAASAVSIPSGMRDPTAPPDQPRT